MLSGHSFNALLKTLEEPPAHVIFLLATTDPQKLPITVLSRCLQFHLKNMPVAAINNQLTNILNKEQIQCEPEALHYIAQSANGSMRDALSILDQAIAHGQGQVVTEKVLTMLGCIDKKHTLNLLSALQQQNAKSLLQECQRITELAADYQHVMADLLHYLTEIAILQAIPDAELTDETQREVLMQFASTISKEDIQLYYQIALMGSKDLSYTPSLQAGFTMTMLRMLSFSPQQKVSSVEPITTVTTPATTTTKMTQTAAPTPTKAPSSDWSQIVTDLSLAGPLLILAKHCSAKTITDSQIELILDAQQAPLLNEKSKQRLTDAISTYFKKDISVIITIGAANIDNTPATIAKKAAHAASEKAQKSIKNDRNVQAILEQFNATINTSTIKTKEE